MRSGERVIIALGTADVAHARNVMKATATEVRIYKIGWQLVLSSHFAMIDYIATLDREVFLDLKLAETAQTLCNVYGMPYHHGCASASRCSACAPTRGPSPV